MSQLDSHPLVPIPRVSVEMCKRMDRDSKIGQKVCVARSYLPSYKGLGPTWLV